MASTAISFDALEALNGDEYALVQELGDWMIERQSDGVLIGIWVRDAVEWMPAVRSDDIEFFERN